MGHYCFHCFKAKYYVFHYDLSDNRPVVRSFKKEEIIYKYFIVLIDNLKYNKKTKFKSVTTLRGALGNN